MSALTPSVVKSDYHAFKGWCLNHRDELTEDESKWLDSWEEWDLACSPMDDAQRCLIRYGHYLGWVAKEIKHVSSAEYFTHDPIQKELAYRPEWVRR